MAGLKLVSVNIEYSKHLDTVSAFLKAESPDVVCIQELREDDIEAIAVVLQAPYHVFSPMTRQLYDGAVHTVGIGIFSRLPIEARSVSFYTNVRELPMSDTSNSKTYNEKLSPVLTVDVRVDAETMRFMTTHFTWSDKGNPTDMQRRDMEELLQILAASGEFVLTGDFNAPRIHEGKPGEIFSKIAGKYKDNIPAKYETSIDLELHRAGKLRPQELSDKMVDGLFTTPGYTASDVVLHTGVSDHCAITANISLRT